jgi:hypothetical protein
MTKLLASSPTKEGCLAAIGEYFYGTAFEILDDGSLRRKSDQKHFPHFKVEQKGKRFRFVEVA